MSHCSRGWNDGARSHVCRLEEGHEPPCTCTYCGAAEGLPPADTAGGRPADPPVWVG